LLLEDIHDLEAAAITVLSTAMPYGQVLIVTNANFQWVKYSLTTFFPALFGFLIDQKIPIISSQDLFSLQAPSNPTLWKYHTFHLMVHSFLSSGLSIQRITSIGDGVYEKVACQAVSWQHHIPCRLIQFLPSPSIPQLLLQLDLLAQDLLALHLTSAEVDPLSLSGLAPERSGSEFKMQILSLGSDEDPLERIELVRSVGSLEPCSLFRDSTR
jgi:hypothetical protein